MGDFELMEQLHGVTTVAQRTWRKTALLSPASWQFMTEALRFDCGLEKTAVHGGSCEHFKTSAILAGSWLKFKNVGG